MVRPRDHGKRKASTPPEVPGADDVTAVRQQRRPAGERRVHTREGGRRVHTAKTRELSRHGSPIAKRGRVIEVSTSEEAEEESEHSRGIAERQPSWRSVFISPYFDAHVYVVAGFSNGLGCAETQFARFSGLKDVPGISKFVYVDVCPDIIMSSVTQNPKVIICVCS